MHHHPAGRPAAATRTGPVVAPVAALLLAAAILLSAGCSDDTAGSSSTTTTAVTTTTTEAPDDAPSLFGDADAALDPNPTAARQRAVRFRARVLLDDQDRARDVERITLNLFPDTAYVGIVDRIDGYSGGYTWVGTLEGFEVSSLTIVWVGGVFAGNFASPEGVYEVSWAEPGIYRVVEIDQGAFPGEG